MISVVVLTFNSEDVIAETVSAALSVSDDVHVVDSFSTDRTVEICKSLGAKVVTHEFVHYAQQRNWSIDNLPLRYDWQLHLDADEILSASLIEEIGALKASWPPDFDAYLIPRLIRFLGRDIRHGGYFPIYHARLFKRGAARCEDRKYDQHFVVRGASGVLRHPFIDDHRASLSEWTRRHNNWSDFEVEDIGSAEAGTLVRPDRTGNPIEQARHRKRSYYRLPLFVRPALLFGYRYVLRLGFLDGTPGLIYCFLQSFWFRFLVDAKMYERRIRRDS